MHLCNIGLIQWHLFPLTDIPVEGQVVGIVGENKSGKSTILDAFQTVMTGCDQSAMGLNRQAAEKGSKGASRRTVSAYCLGRLGDNEETIRLESNTYLLLAFKDPAEKKRPVTLGLALQARRSESTVHVSSRFIVEGTVLTAADLVPEVDGVRKIQAWSECRRDVQALVESRGATITEYRDTAKEFVREFMHAMFYKSRTASQAQFVKNLVNAITFREMVSANEFVRNFLLPEDKLPVGSLRGSIRVYRDAAKAVADMKSKLAALKALEALKAELDAARSRVATGRWIESRARAASALAALGNARRELSSKLGERKRMEGEAERLRSAKKDIEYELGKLRDRKRNLRSDERAGQLSSTLAGLTAERREVARPIQSAFQALFGLTRYAPTLKRLDARFVEALDAAGAHVPPLLGPDAGMPRDPAAFDAALVYLLSLADQIEGTIETASHRTRVRRDELLAERRDLVARVRAAKEGRISLSANVATMQSRLLEAGIPSQVLCELVEVGDHEWARAAEGFLANARETIIVAPEDNVRATEIQLGEASRLPGVLIANSRKLASKPIKGNEGTLASVFRSSHPVAMALLVSKTGGIRLAAERSDLDRDGRWIMKTGMFDDGTSISIKQVHGGLKLGLRAQRSAAVAHEARLTTLETELQAAESDVRAVSDVARAVRKLAELSPADGSPPSAVALAPAVAALEARAAEIRDEIELLADMDVSSVEEEISGAEEELAAADRKLTDALIALGGIDTTTRELRRRIDAGPDALGSRLHAAYRVKLFRKQRLTVAPLDARRAYAREMADETSPSALAERMRLEVSEAAEEVQDTERDARSEARRCLDLMDVGDLFEDGAGLVDAISTWLAESIAEIEDETLVHFEFELESARRQSEDMFRNSFVHELAGRFAKVRTELDDIRNVLKNYPFLGERYTFRSAAAPGYEAFHRIVERQRELLDSNTPLFRGTVDGDGTLSDDLREVQSVLLTDNIDIEPYEDYRRYFTFEIEITDIASGRVASWTDRRGTASGGETQTPYYVALVSALSSIYFGSAGRRAGSHEAGLCIAAFDEAFSKMDEKVRYRMVEYCRELGLQLLLCGPDGGRQSMERYAHTLVDVWRSGDQSFAVPDIIKPPVREGISAIDPSLLPRERVQQMMMDL